MVPNKVLSEKNMSLKLNQLLVDSSCKCEDSDEDQSDKAKQMQKPDTI